MISSGLKGRTAGQVRGRPPEFLAARRRAAIGQFIVVPSPLPRPVSSRRPVHGYQGDWCVLK